MATPSASSDGMANAPIDGHGSSSPDDPVAIRLREARRAKGWTQQLVADELHVSRRAVSEWETGVRQPFSHLPELAALYAVSTSFLLYGVEPSSVELHALRLEMTQLLESQGRVETAVEQLSERLVELAEQTAQALVELRQRLR